jgi:hypothetical protein
MSPRNRKIFMANGSMDSVRTRRLVCYFLPRPRDELHTSRYMLDYLPTCHPNCTIHGKNKYCTVLVRARSLGKMKTNSLSSCMHDCSCRMATDSSQSPSDHRLCQKCKSVPGIHAIRRATVHYCSECLTASLKKKVRTALVEATSTGSRLAMAVSGGPPSSSWCAWHVLTQHIRHKKTSGLDVEALHVSFETEEDSKDALDFDIDGPLRVIRLQSTALNSVQDPTGREDLRKILIQHALKQELAKGEYECMLLGHTSDTLAADAVAAAAKGQGHILGSIGKPSNGMAYVMRDIGGDQVDAYARAWGPSCPESNDTTHGNGTNGDRNDAIDKKNVHSLSRLFVGQLLESNPGGVSNILGTVGKLVPGAEGKDCSEAQPGSGRCSLCEAVLILEENMNRHGVCDACTAGIFGDWKDEEAALATLNGLPSDLRQRFLLE